MNPVMRDICHYRRVSADQPPYALWRYADAQMCKHAFDELVGLISETAFQVMWQDSGLSELFTLSQEEIDLLDLCDALLEKL